MQEHAQDTLMVVLSSVVFGLGGFGLAPDQVKGAAAGSVAGAAIAVGQVQQTRRIRKLAAQQSQRLGPSKGFTGAVPKNSRMADLSGPVERKIRKIEHSLSTQQAKIFEFENTFRSSSTQARLTQIEINKIRKQLSSSKLLDEALTDGADTVQATSFENRLTSLEATVRSIQATSTDGENSLKSETTETDLDILGVESDSEEGEVADWLANKQIELERFYEPDSKVDQLLDGLSNYLGDNYTVLRQLHWKLRTTVGGGFYFGLSSYEPREKSILNQYVKKLKASDYLARGKLVKKIDKPDVIVAVSHNRSDIQGFFNGGWFERFVFYKIIELLDSEGLNYQYLRNAKIVYPDERNSELDLLFLIEGQPLLIECKAGSNYDSGIEKFSEHPKRLEIAPDNAVFVVLEIDELQAHIRNKNWGITVVDRNSLLGHIRSIIPVQEDTDALEEIDPEGSSSREQGEGNPQEATLQNFFKERGYGRSPELRGIIIDALIKAMEASGKDQTFNILIKTVRDNTKPKHPLSIKQGNRT
jgi:hypothetical protein